MGGGGGGEGGFSHLTPPSSTLLHMNKDIGAQMERQINSHSDKTEPRHPDRRAVARGGSQYIALNAGVALALQKVSGTGSNHGANTGRRH